MLHEIEKTNNEPQRCRNAEKAAGCWEVRSYPHIRISVVRFIVLILPVLLLSLTGCYRTITGKVVDAETGKPIEGAVILAEWTITKGLGYTGTFSYKVVEAVTDKDGNATISGNFTINPLVNRPSVTVYKKGYVAWNNKYIFPDYKNRANFKWDNGYVFQLERFKPEYSYDKHTSFIHRAIGLGMGEKPLMLKAIDWEENMAFEERQKGGRK